MKAVQWASSASMVRGIALPSQVLVWAFGIPSLGASGHPNHPPCPRWIPP